jgi:flagellin-like hook-associated protein FlgL
MELLSGDKGNAANYNPWGDTAEGAFFHIGSNNIKTEDLLNIKMDAADSRALKIRGAIDIEFHDSASSQALTLALTGVADDSLVGTPKRLDEDGNLTLDPKGETRPILDPAPGRPRVIDYDPLTKSMANGIVLDLTTRESAEEGIMIVRDAMEKVNTLRAKIGSYTNRLEGALSNQMNMLVNVTEAESQIRDADFAVESMNFSRLQVLNQASTAMLSQANSLPQSILQLLNNV